MSALLLAFNAGMRLPLERADAQVSPALALRAQRAMDVWAFDPHLAHLASLHWGWAAQSDPSLAAARPDLAASERAVALDRRDPFIALEHARTLRYYGADPAAVEEAFLEALRRWPAYPIARLEYIDHLVSAGRGDDARTQLLLFEKSVPDDAASAAELARVRGMLQGSP